MPNLSRPARILFAIVLLAAVAACGDDGSNSSNDDGASDESDAEDAGSGDGGASSGPVGARVTVGDETFEATNELVCIRMGGALSANFSNDDNTISIYIDLPPDGWETDTQSNWDPPGVRVDDEATDPMAQWTSGGAEVTFELGEEPETVVNSYTVDGAHGQGTGNFIDTYAGMAGNPAEPVDGSFEVICG